MSIELQINGFEGSFSETVKESHTAEVLLVSGGGGPPSPDAILVSVGERWVLLPLFSLSPI